MNWEIQIQEVAETPRRGIASNLVSLRASIFTYNDPSSGVVFRAFGDPPPPIPRAGDRYWLVSEEDFQKLYPPARFVMRDEEAG